jgi:hypothetical protein
MRCVLSCSSESLANAGGDGDCRPMDEFAIGDTGKRGRGGGESGVEAATSNALI